MSFSLSFEKITADDGQEILKALSEMATFTFADTFRHYDPADLEAYLEESLSVGALREDLKKEANHYYFVILNGERVGYLKWIFPTTTYLQHVKLDYSFPLLIERFYFLPEQCGKGLAAVALAFITSFAKCEAQADFLYLSVWEKNYRAQRFYQKHGFRTLGSFDYPVGSVVDREFLYGKPLGSLPARAEG